MNLKELFKLVEIKTKVTTILPFILASLFTIYKFDRFNILNAVLFFFSMLLIDLCTTSLNNYMDYLKAVKKEGYGFTEHNVMGSGRVTESQARLVIAATFLSAMILGIILFTRTNFLVLIIGVISFAVGISYSFGPLPISRTPLGEILSGMFNGLVVMFLAVFIHIEKDLMDLTFFGKKFMFSGNIEYLFYVILLSIPAWMTISNVMLANNICDIEDDKVNRRHTLPVIVGEEKSLKLFVLLYIIAAVAIVVATVVKILPLTSLIMIPIFYGVYLNVKKFIVKHIKKETFKLSVQNHIMVTVGMIFTILTGILFKL